MLSGLSRPQGSRLERLLRAALPACAVLHRVYHLALPPMCVALLNVRSTTRSLRRSSSWAAGWTRSPRASARASACDSAVSGGTLAPIDRCCVHGFACLFVTLPHAFMRVLAVLCGPGTGECSAHQRCLLLLAWVDSR
jgi:hypothetical protein